MSAASYRDPCWYTPPDLPVPFQVFDTPVAHLGVGSAGKVGVLDLALAPVAGATRLVRHFQQMPLYLFHPIYIDPGRPDMAFLYLLQGGDGLLQGDRYRMDITCAPGAAVHITTQAASKLYRMADNFASQLINLRVGAGAYLEYLPDPVIPFRDARYYQRLGLTVDPTASVILGETLLPGRVARGEAHAYTLYYADLAASAPDGDLLFADRLVLDPAAMTPRSPGRLGSHDVLATLYVVTHQCPPAELVAALRDALAAQDAVLAGVSALPNDCGAVARLLGPTSLTVKNALHRAWRAARLLLIGVPPPDLRKG
ncbi:MAG: urease accessory protein UreD [Thermomicrobiales bacterium]|nr:urease accessory protein UreD [Thermomicrobiales bacterium]